MTAQENRWNSDERAISRQRATTNCTSRLGIFLQRLTMERTAPTFMATDLVSSSSNLTVAALWNTMLTSDTRRLRRKAEGLDVEICTSCNGPGFDPSIRRHSEI